MNALLSKVIEAQGGLERWRKFYTLSAHVKIGGVLWDLKGQGGVFDDVNVHINLLEQKASFYPIRHPEWHSDYSPNRIAIENSNDAVIEESYNPRSTFAGHTLETKWSRLQLAYFTGYATWSYLNTPFQFARPGFVVTETEPWEENDQTWRRLNVKWPTDIHTHSAEQVFYVDENGLIGRLDYDVEVSGGAAAAHYLSDYREVAGIMIPTKRMVYIRQADNTPQLDGPLVVSASYSDMVLS